MLRSSLQQVFLALLATSLIVGCDSTGSSPDNSDSPSGEGGAVSFSLVRTANSNVPSDADSAFVRVWRPNGSFNLVEFVNIPDPGQQTEVTLDAPADQGYRAGVLAVTPESQSYPPEKDLLAHGSSESFTVQSNDTSQISLDVRVADVTLEAPESLLPNRTDTIRVVYGLNPPGIGRIFDIRQGSKHTFNYLDGSILNEIESSSTDTTASGKFEVSAPNVDGEDTTYVKARILPVSSSDAKWTTSTRELGSSYFPSENGLSFEIPVVPENKDDGTVVITFSRNEDGWERTRRVVE